VSLKLFKVALGIQIDLSACHLENTAICGCCTIVLFVTIWKRRTDSKDPSIQVYDNFHCSIDTISAVRLAGA
jgi:hypothetical protein